MKLNRLAILLCVGLLAGEAQANDPAPDSKTASSECLPTWPAKDGRDFLKYITNGWRPLEVEAGYWKINEVRNVQVIYDVFKRHGYSDAIAYAAIVNAMEESALDNTAVMSTPFRWKDKYYPKGTRAVGLFQLLPSVSGAGGPSGKEEGYSRDFMGRRYAGTAWQASRYFDRPDWRGRRYYNGQNPRLNTERIVLEIERDGYKLVRADERGASIADLVYIFARDIERPSVNVWHRRKRAGKMLGWDIAFAKQPDLLFPSDYELPPAPYEPPETCTVPLSPDVEERHPVVQAALNASLPLSLVLFGLFLVALGQVRTEDQLELS